MEFCKVSQIMSPRCSSETYLNGATLSEQLPGKGSRSRWREIVQVVLLVF